MTKEKQGSYDEFKWTVENEISLFEAMTNYKVVGTNRFFNMALILEKLSDMNKFIPVDIIWNHLNTMYDIEALNDMETFNTETEDFTLPSTEFSELMKIHSNSEENKSISNKVIGKSKIEPKDNLKTTPRREEKISKITPRRDSAFKDTNLKLSSTPKPIVKMDIDKKNVVKSKTRKSSDVSISPIPSNANRISRSTRGSLKPEESTPTRSRSPVNNIKRRTRTDLK